MLVFMFPDPQVCSITLWMCDDYYYYAACIIIISLISITVSLSETRRQAQSLHDMVTGAEGRSEVLRPGTGKVNRETDVHYCCQPFSIIRLRLVTASWCPGT